MSRTKSVKQIIFILLSAIAFFANVMLPASVFAGDDWGNPYECPYCGEIRNFDGGDTHCADCYGCSQDTNEECFKENHCEECLECFSTLVEGDDFCAECHRCHNCWNVPDHCAHCYEHKDHGLCLDCLDAGIMVCLDCHESYRGVNAFCDICDGCMLAYAESGGHLCTGADGGDEPHCDIHCEDATCSSCGKCFVMRPDFFCEICELCLECAFGDGKHCLDCGEDFEEVDRCGDDGVYCVGCCPPEFHCPLCNEHLGDDDTNWCDGGMDTHCKNCAYGEGWICERCDECLECTGKEMCEDCYLCEECHEAYGAELGCSCGLCPPSAEWDDPEHICAECGESMSCTDGAFCTDCGLCMECCTENSLDSGCECGLCVEGAEWEDHICENCGNFFCQSGDDACNDCGFCVDCCMENSEAAGCDCLTCVESSDFESEEHMCRNCNESLSCVDEFCEYCGLCMNCCEDNSESESCSHLVCVESDEWEEHYCEECGLCKEDCDCEEPCCTGVEKEDCECCDECTGDRSCECECEECCCHEGIILNALARGAIIHEPADYRRRISERSYLDKSENTVTFHARAFGDNLSYQWYRQVGDDGQPVAIEDKDVTLQDSGVTYDLITGSNTYDLTVFVPEDACWLEYYYFCVVTDSKTGEVLSVTRKARLNGRHVYKWTYLNDKVHGMRCVSKGCNSIRNENDYGRYAISEHEPGVLRIYTLATVDHEGELIRQCRVCGGTLETVKVPKLDEHHTHDYLYIPDPKIKNMHYRVCICGAVEGLPEAHTYGPWEIVTEADETRKGEKMRECVYCLYQDRQEIPLQTHKHKYNFENWDDPISLENTYANDFYHWQECQDPNCVATAGKEYHKWSDWELEIAPGPKNAGAISRECLTCGYDQSKPIKEGYYFLSAVNCKTNAVSFRPDRTMKLTAKVPKGYEFDHWESTCDDFDITFSDIRSPETLVTIGQDKNPVLNDGVLDTYYNFASVEAVCKKKYNVIQVKDRKGNVHNLTPGMMLDNDFNVTDDVNRCAIQYEYFNPGTDSNNDRVVLNLFDYTGGSIYLTSMGLPCDLGVYVNGECDITETGYWDDDPTFGIKGCASGGLVGVHSASGGLLRINVEGISPIVTGIMSQSNSKLFADDIRISGVKLEIKSVASPVNSKSTAYGIYSKGQVNAYSDMYIKCESVDENTSSNTCTGIYAGKEINLSGADLVVDTRKCGTNKKGLALSAKNINADNRITLKFDYPDKQTTFYHGNLNYNKDEYITWEERLGYYANALGVNNFIGTGKEFTMEPGHRFRLTDEGFADGVPAVMYPDEHWRQDEDGNYLVPTGKDFGFTITPKRGYYTMGICDVYGNTIKAESTGDQYTYHFMLEETEDDGMITIPTTGVKRFDPFTSAPTPSEQTVLLNNDITVSWTMDNIDYVNLKDISKALGDTEFVMYLEMDNEGDWEVIKEITPDISGSVSFSGKDFAEVGETGDFRLSILFNGESYSSDTFSVTWTDDPNEVTRTSVNSVEVYVQQAYNSSYEDGGSWFKLDAASPYLVYEGATDKYKSLKRSEYERLGGRYTVLAKFDSNSGTLSLMGDNLNDRLFSGIIQAINVPDSTEGDLTVKVEGSTATIGTNLSYIGWIDAYGDGNLVHNMPTSIITNRNGSVIVASKNNTELVIEGTADQSPFTTPEIAGISARDGFVLNGDGSLTMWIKGNTNTYDDEDLVNRYGIAVSDGDIRVDDKSKLSIYMTYDNVNGKAEAIKAGNGNVRLTGYSKTILDGTQVPTTGISAFNGNVIIDNYASLSADVMGKASPMGGIETCAISTNQKAEFLTNGRIELKVPAFKDYSVAVDAWDGLKFSGNNYREFRWDTYGSWGSMLSDDTEFDWTETNWLREHYDLGDNTDQEIFYSGKTKTVSVEMPWELNNFQSFISVQAQNGDYRSARYANNAKSLAGDTIDVILGLFDTPYTVSSWNSGNSILKNLENGQNILTFTMPIENVKIKPEINGSAFAFEPSYIKLEDGTMILHWGVYKQMGDWTFDSADYAAINNEGKVDGYVYLFDDERKEIVDESGRTIVVVDTKLDPNAMVSGVDGSGYSMSSMDKYSIVANMRRDSGDPVEAFSTPVNTNWYLYYYTAKGTVFDDGILHTQSLDIPNGNVGERFTFDLSKLLSTDGHYRYRMYMADENGDLMKQGYVNYRVSMDGIVMVDRMQEHGAIDFSKQLCYVAVTDSDTNTTMNLYFSMGEIGASSIVKYDTFVNGIQITDANSEDILGDGTVKYVADNGTGKAKLILNEARLDSARNESLNGADGYVGGILSFENLDIELIGENLISYNLSNVVDGKNAIKASDARYAAAIAVGNGKSCTFSGEGSLALKGKYAVCVDGTCLIDGPSITFATAKGVNPYSGTLVYKNGEIISNMTSTEAIYDGFALGNLVMDPAAPEDMDLWIVDKNPETGDRRSILSNVDEYNFGFYNKNGYRPSGAYITKHELESLINTDLDEKAGEVVCHVEVGGNKTGRAELIAAQYLDGHMIGIQKSDVIIELSAGGTVIFDFNPADGAEYSAFLFYEGTMIPVCKNYKSNP